MPAPNTSTDVMPVVEPSIGTPLQCETASTTFAATRSPRPITARGTSQSHGLRYVTISSRATTAAVTSSRRTSAPSKTAPRSAWIAGAPVTWASRPSGRPSRSSARRVSTRSVFCSASTSPSRGTVSSATVPSCDGTGPATRVSSFEPRVPPSRSSAARSVCDSRSPPREATTIAGASSPPGSAARRCWASADSASSGRFTEALVLWVAAGARMRTAPAITRPSRRTTTDRPRPTSRARANVR